MTPTQILVDRTIGAIYDTVLAPELWPDALTAVTECFDAAGTLLYFRCADGTFTLLHSPGLKPIANVFFDTAWRHQDLRAIRAAERDLHLTLPAVSDEDLATPEEIETHPFYTEFLGSYGLKWFMAASLAPTTQDFVFLSVQQFANRRPFTADQKKMLERLARHAERALHLSCRLMRAELANQAMRDALDRIGCGVAMLDHDESVVFANRLGKLFMTVEDGRKRLRPVSAFDVGPDAASADPLDIAGERPMVVEGEHGVRAVAYRLPVTSATRDMLVETFGNVRAIVLFLTQQEGEPVDPAVVRDLLGITLGEARVASLVGAGQTPREASLALGITEETARTLLERVFHKIEISKQSQLVALLTRLSVRGGR
jgi:DNA-binding CsgD family transcriptional regulator